MKIIELADRYGVPIIEDDPYGHSFRWYEGEDIPSVEILDSRVREQNGTYTGNVIYLSIPFFQDPCPRGCAWPGWLHRIQ